MSPSNYDEWMDVANERRVDAQRLSEQQREIASFYLAGYVIECSLKACLVHQGQRPLKIHDLWALWKQCGFQLSDLKDTTGTKAYFLTEWSTDWRYEASASLDFSSGELLNGARHISGFINSVTRRQGNRGRRR